MTQFLLQFAAGRTCSQQNSCPRVVFNVPLGGCLVLSDLRFHTIDSFPRILTCTGREIENTLQQHHLPTGKCWFQESRSIATIATPHRIRASSTSSPGSRLCSGSSAALRSSSRRPDTAPKYTLSVSDHRGHSASVPLNVSGLEVSNVSKLAGSKSIVLTLAASSVASATCRAVHSAFLSSCVTMMPVSFFTELLCSSVLFLQRHVGVLQLTESLQHFPPSCRHPLSPLSLRS